MCARDRIRADGSFAAPAFTLVLIFVGVVLMPMTLYLYLAHPAWTWMYMIDPDSVPALAILPLLALHGGILVLGWYVGARLVRVERERIALYAAAVGVVAVLVAVPLSWSRLGRYGTFAEFTEGRALTIMEVKLGYVLVAMVVGVITAGAYVVLELLRDSRRVRSR